MTAKPLNILLADDDLDDCFFFNEALNEFPKSTHLTAVHDGEQLMNLLSNENNELPDVLFLDLNMPRKNGFECLTEIKHNRKLKHFPVVVYSTSLEETVVNLLYKNGAQYFIRKPAEFPKFKRMIQQTLKLIMQETVLLPSREDFVLTVQKEPIT